MPSAAPKRSRWPTAVGWCAFSEPNPAPAPKVRYSAVGRPANSAQSFLIAGACASLALSACVALPRLPAPSLGGDAAPDGFPSTVRTISSDWHRVEVESPGILEQAVGAAHGERVHILALSGGGAGAAYGAGALVGWTRSATRPRFQIVTGVSAGALIAPFAFLGPDWDDRLTDAFSGEASRGLLRRSVFGALFGTSLYRGQPLQALVDRFVTDELLAAVAAMAAQGPLLVVATTDLDREETVLWNLGAIARTGGARARALFRDVLVASASIPGIFPPVLIDVEQNGHAYQELHVDGGATTSVFVAPEVASIIPFSTTDLSGAETFLLVNGQFASPSSSTQRQTFGILRRSVMATMRSSLRAGTETALLTAEKLGMSVRVTEIPNDYPFRGSMDFDPGRMRQLFDFGARCGALSQIWGTPLQALQRNEVVQHPAEYTQVACPAP